MQIILASAKIMRERCPGLGIVPSEPLFQPQAEALAAEMSLRTAAELSELFGVSPAIAAQNRQRFAVFASDEAELMPAILAYNGQAYKHLRADSLSLPELQWADAHLWISSCLYGLLRPLNGINQYRMEGGFPLRATGGLKVSDFWRPLLTDVLISSVKADDGILVYLDTEEFRTLFDWKKVLSEVTVIEPQFHVAKAGRLTTPSVWAKTCRGAMARYLIRSAACPASAATRSSLAAAPASAGLASGLVAAPAAPAGPASADVQRLIEAFEYEGFRFSPDHSRPGFPNFVRP